MILTNAKLKLRGQLMTKIYIICDLEGTAGVVDHRQQCWFDGKYYEQARRLATLELNALVEGALQGGATEIAAWDGHGPFPGGIDVELLHPACRLVMGAGNAGPTGYEGFDAMFMVGFHAMAGTPRAVLAHSFMGNIAECRLNGLKLGEIGLNCLTLGMAGIPCVFLAGDQAAADEVRALIPGVETAVVKKGLSPTPVGILTQAPMVSLSPARAQEVIRESARRAMNLVGKIAPFRLEPPYTAQVRFSEEKCANQSAQAEGVRRLDTLTVEKSGNDLDGIMPF
jgi:D-amino peptidase